MWTDSPAGLLINPLLGSSAAGNVRMVPDPVAGGVAGVSPWNGQKANTVVVIGDSIASAFYNTSGHSVAWSDLGFVSWAQALSSHRLQVRNPAAATGGTTTTDWVSSTYDVEKTVIPYSPGWCIVCLGINDISSDVPVATTIANFKIIFGKLLAAGIKVIANTITPYGAAYTIIGDAITLKNPRMNQVNQWMAQYASVTTGFYLVDAYSIIVDPTSTSGYSVAANQRDGLHPSQQGARAIGAAVASVINKYAVDTQYHTSGYSDGFDYSASAFNRMSNSLFQGAGGTTSPGAGTTITATQIATSWTVASTAGGTSTTVCTTEARTLLADGDTIGNNQKLVITLTNSTDIIYLRSGSLGARFSAGDEVYGEMYVRISGASAVKGYRCSITTTASAITYTGTDLSTTFNTFDQSDGVFLLQTPHIIVPSGALSATIFDFEIAFSGAGGATVYVGRAAWRKVVP